MMHRFAGCSDAYNVAVVTAATSVVWFAATLGGTSAVAYATGSGPTGEIPKGSIACQDASDCLELVGRGSGCLADGEEGSGGTCTNPFAGGCLAALLPDWTKKRVCNSDDNILGGGSGGDEPPDHCRIPDIDYMEFRMFTHNWESAGFAAWLLQILLSEMLDVPTTIETGLPDAVMNFYNPTRNSFEFGKVYDYSSLELAHEIRDCRYANPVRGSKSEQQRPYRPCAHAFPELWQGVPEQTLGLVYHGVLNPPEGLGMIGRSAWFAPKFTVENEPSIATYIGLMGEENRRKLADLFRRPTSWKAYCNEISSSGCTVPDRVAQRAPQSSSEEQRFFVEGLYTGHFRKTEKNDCDANPTTCTGHFADYPCSWHSWFPQQVYHLNIALEAGEAEPGSGGYTYPQLVDIWRASNATRSHLAMMYWKPELLFHEFQGTEAEFTRISLPAPSRECFDDRVPPSGRCGDDFEAKVGVNRTRGVCEDRAYPVHKGVVSNLRDGDTIPTAIRTPGPDAFDLFTLDEIQLAEIFGFLNEGLTPKHAVCRWAAENIEVLERFIPRAYPRVLQDDSSVTSLVYAAVVFGAIATLTVLITTYLVYRNKEEQIIKMSQVEFIFLLLFGAFLIAVGSILAAVPSTDGSCVTELWAINLGYTLELVPLIVKVAAINRIVRASQRMRRIRMKKRSLFGAVATISAFVIIFCIIWTVVDPPTITKEYELTNEEQEDGSTVVSVRYYCSSKSDMWWLITAGWNALLLLCATVLAFQMRKAKGVFNESRTLAFLIYSHFVFVIMRLVTVFLDDSVGISNWALTKIRSLLFSLDTTVAVIVYFVPKLVAVYQKETPSRNSSAYFNASTGPSNTFVSGLNNFGAPIVRVISNITFVSKFEPDAFSTTHGTDCAGMGGGDVSNATNAEIVFVSNQDSTVKEAGFNESIDKIVVSPNSSNEPADVMVTTDEVSDRGQQDTLLGKISQLEQENARLLEKLLAAGLQPEDA